MPLAKACRAESTCTATSSITPDRHRSIQPALAQVMTNIINNAVAAVAPAGNITVELTARALTTNEQATELLPDGEYFCITVTDDGPGMTEDVRSRVFEPFFTTRDVGQGTGLGLAVSFGIIKDWGGSISVQSKPNAGACFKILIPMIEPAKA